MIRVVQVRILGRVGVRRLLEVQLAGLAVPGEVEPIGAEQVPGRDGVALVRVGRDVGAHQRAHALAHLDLCQARDHRRVVDVVDGDGDRVLVTRVVSRVDDMDMHRVGVLRLIVERLGHAQCTALGDGEFVRFSRQRPGDRPVFRGEVADPQRGQVAGPVLVDANRARTVEHQRFCAAVGDRHGHVHRAVGLTVVGSDRHLVHVVAVRVGGRLVVRRVAEVQIALVVDLEVAAVDPCDAPLHGGFGVHVAIAEVVDERRARFLEVEGSLAADLGRVVGVDDRDLDDVRVTRGKRVAIDNDAEIEVFGVELGAGLLEIERRAQTQRPARRDAELVVVVAVQPPAHHAAGGIPTAERPDVPGPVLVHVEFARAVDHDRIALGILHRHRHVLLAVERAVVDPQRDVVHVVPAPVAGRLKVGRLLEVQLPVFGVELELSGVNAAQPPIGEVCYIVTALFRIVVPISPNQGDLVLVHGDVVAARDCGRLVHIND